MQGQVNIKRRRSYIEFLYILPFLLLVALFSYFPLYGCGVYQVEVDLKNAAAAQ